MDFSMLTVFGAGLLTFLSPCVLPLAPILAASFAVGGGRTSRWSRLHSTVWFVLGFTTVFVLFGLSVPAISDTLSGIRPILMALGGLVLVLFGLKMMRFMSGTGSFAWMNRTLQIPRLGRLSAGGAHGMLFGAIFGLSWTPCVGPILGGVLTYVAAQERTPWQGGALLASFAMGIGLPLLALAASFDRVNPLLKRLRPHLGKIEYAAGIGLFVFGIFILNQLRLQSFVPVRSGNDTNLTAIDHSGRLVSLGADEERLSRMIFFHSEHCPMCHAMEDHLPEFEKNCASADFQFIRINVDNPANAKVAEHFDVRAVPTISVIDKRGNEIIHLVGYQTQARLREAVQRTTNGKCLHAGGPRLGKFVAQH